MTAFPKTLCLTLMILAGLNQACSEKSFSTGAPDSKQGLIGGNGNPTCRDQLSEQTVPVKVVLVVDTSGSNVRQGTNPGTDPDKRQRGGSIQDFFNSYRNQTNFSWSFLVFQGSSAFSLIGNSSVAPNFSLDATEMQQAINRFYDGFDEGNTPYRAALAKAHQAILNDYSSTRETKYIVIFISDGVPDPAVSNSTLRSDIENLMAAKPGQISLSSIYYGPYNQEASDRLAVMALYGGGGFLDANSSNGQTFQIESVIQVPGTNCQP